MGRGKETLDELAETSSECKGMTITEVESSRKERAIQLGVKAQVVWTLGPYSSKIFVLRTLGLCAQSVTKDPGAEQVTNRS